MKIYATVCKNISKDMAITITNLYVGESEIVAIKEATKAKSNLEGMTFIHIQTWEDGTLISTEKIDICSIGGIK